MALTKQPWQIKTVGELERFTELAKRKPINVLAAEFNISEQSVKRYLACLREGQTLKITGASDTKKLTAEELVNKHKGKPQYMAWT